MRLAQTVGKSTDEANAKPAFLFTIQSLLSALRVGDVHAKQVGVDLLVGAAGSMGYVQAACKKRAFLNWCKDTVRDQMGRADGGGGGTARGGGGRRPGRGRGGRRSKHRA